MTRSTNAVSPMFTFWVTGENEMVAAWAPVVAPASRAAASASVVVSLFNMFESSIHGAAHGAEARVDDVDPSAVVRVARITRGRHRIARGVDQPDVHHVHVLVTVHVARQTIHRRPGLARRVADGAIARPDAAQDGVHAGDR